MGGMTQQGTLADERGFSLVEVLTAMILLTVGLLPLVGLFSASVQRMTASTPMVTAREKAREAIESVHAARDSGEASWPTINNVSNGGVFLDGEQPVRLPGNDGLVNTIDDGVPEAAVGEFTREIVISPVNLDGVAAVNPRLREVRVVVHYKVYGSWRQYVMTTYVSSYS